MQKRRFCCSRRRLGIDLGRFGALLGAPGRPFWCPGAPLAVPGRLLGRAWSDPGTLRAAPGTSLERLWWPERVPRSISGRFWLPQDAPGRNVGSILRAFPMLTNGCVLARLGKQQRNEWQRKTPSQVARPTRPASSLVPARSYQLELLACQVAQRWLPSLGARATSIDIGYLDRPRSTHFDRLARFDEPRLARPARPASSSYSRRPARPASSSYSRANDGCGSCKRAPCWSQQHWLCEPSHLDRPASSMKLPDRPDVATFC